MSERAGTAGTIVLIHGLWVTPKCFEPWKQHFLAAGHDVRVPPWPGVSDDIDALRRDPSRLNGLRINAVADHLAAFVDGVVAETGEQPIIMGHSIGGMITQMLRNPFTVSGTVLLSARQFHYAMTNTSDLGQSELIREALHIPGSGRVVWQTAANLLTNTGDSKIDYGKTDRAPLLFIAGGRDHIVPAKINHKNAKAYKAGVVEVKEFADRSHDIIASDGWEEVADYALNWATTTRTWRDSTNPQSVEGVTKP